MTQRNPDFSEILAALRAEEIEPTYSALSRWQKRYPQFRDDLEDYFANWAITFADDLKLEDPEAKTGPNERWLADFGVAYAMQIMRRQQAGIRDDRIEPLTEFERLVLTAISVQRTPRWRYLDRIADTVRELSHHHHLRSSVLETLQSMQERFLVFSWSPNPDKHPDESAKTYFFLSSMGEASLKKARNTARKKD